jgi:hypothetical protein
MRIANPKYAPIKALADFKQAEGDLSKANCLISWRESLIVQAEAATYFVGTINSARELKLEEPSLFIWTIHTKPYSYYSFEASKRVEIEPDRLSLFLVDYLKRHQLIGKCFKGALNWYVNNFLLEEYQQKDEVSFWLNGEFCDEIPDYLKDIPSKLGSGNGKSYSTRSLSDKAQEKLDFIFQFYLDNAGPNFEDPVIKDMVNPAQKALYAWMNLDDDAKKLLTLLLS